MPRINVEEEWFDDPRRTQLCTLVGMGVETVAIAMWKLSQRYYRQGVLTVPKDKFEMMPCWKEFEQVGLARREGEGVYICGTKERHAWLRNRVDAARRGGASKSPEKLKHLKQNRSKTEAKPKSTEASSSSSSSFSNTNTEESRNPVSPLTPLAAFWNAKASKLPKVREMTEDRRRRERQRVAALGEDKIREAVERAASTPFCQGDNQRGWKLTYDFLIASDNNVLKVLEGKYGKSTSHQSGETPDWVKEASSANG